MVRQMRIGRQGRVYAVRADASVVRGRRRHDRKMTRGSADEFCDDAKV